MVHEPLAHSANVFVLWVTSVMQMIEAKVATYADNVTSIKIVKAMKFASNLDVAIEIVSMLAANSLVDRMHCAYQIIIDQRVFAVMDSPVIQMISMLDVNQVNNFVCQIHARVMQIVHRVKFVWLASMELEIV